MPQHNESASEPSGLSEGVQQSVKTDFEDGEIALQVIDPEMQGIAGDVMRSAGYPVLLWQRVRALEQRLRACEDRLQAAEAGLSKPGTLRGRVRALAAQAHWSDCAVHSEPAFPAGPCDCGAVNASQGFWSSVYRLGCIRASYLRMNWKWIAARGFPSLRKAANPGPCRSSNSRQPDTRSAPGPRPPLRQEDAALQGADGRDSEKTEGGDS